MIRSKLQEGTNYARWTPEQRFAFIRDALVLLSQVPSFQIDASVGRGQSRTEWSTVLRWWLLKSTLAVQPTPKQIPSWYDFVAQNFIYRSTWGLGSVIGVLLDVAEGDQPVQPLEIGDWPRSGLPWVSFWMKELLTWGIHDPVAAFLLARGDAIDRPRAEADAREYYNGVPENVDANSILDPRLIRDWVNARRERRAEPVVIQEFTIKATLSRPAADYLSPRIMAAPLDADGGLIWIDPAGYVVARSARPRGWPEDPSAFAFELAVEQAHVVGSKYLQHA